MRAMVMREFGSPDVLRLEDVPEPQPGEGEALVRVAAVGVARTRDVATRSGEHAFSRQVTLPHVLGGDFAGVVAAVGPGVDGSLVGRRVAVMNTHTCGRCASCRAGRENECTELSMLGIHRWGAYAEAVAVPADSVHPLPDDIDLADAAALAANGPIALTQLRRVAAADGAWILVPGVSGALAMVIAALAARLGVRVAGTSRRPELVPEGLDVAVLDPAAPDLAESLVALTGGGPDGVIDNVGVPDLFDRYFPTLRNGARIVVSGAIGEGAPPVVRVPLASLYVRSLALIGVRTATSAAVREFWSLVRDGFRMPAGLTRRWRLEDASDVHAAIEDGTASGHNVLVLDGVPA